MGLQYSTTFIFKTVELVVFKYSRLHLQLVQGSNLATTVAVGTLLNGLHTREISRHIFHLISKAKTAVKDVPAKNSTSASSFYLDLWEITRDNTGYDYPDLPSE
jgi:hypothetical protein